jgi:hypothetical protein
MEPLWSPVVATGGSQRQIDFTVTSTGPGWLCHPGDPPSGSCSALPQGEEALVAPAPGAAIEIHIAPPPASGDLGVLRSFAESAPRKKRDAEPRPTLRLEAEAAFHASSMKLCERRVPGSRRHTRRLELVMDQLSVVGSDPATVTLP